MNRGTGAVLAAFIIATGGFFGCAHSRHAATDEQPAAAAQSLPPAPESAPAEDRASAPLSEEEQLLLKDDADWTAKPDEKIYAVADPLETFNRGIYYFNDKLYFWVIKPVAQGYRAVVPQTARNGIKNFFDNITAPISIANNILQGKGRAAEAEWTKFLYNTTVGVLGFGNPAGRHPELNPDPEDLGQTLAVYGLGDGFYLMWPVMGPSTLRDSVGMLGDRFLNPLAYVESWEASMALSGTEEINYLSFRIGDYEAMKKAALDPYASFRNVYIQLRQSRIKQ